MLQSFSSAHMQSLLRAKWVSLFPCAFILHYDLIFLLVSHLLVVFIPQLKVILYSTMILYSSFLINLYIITIFLCIVVLVITNFDHKFYYNFKFINSFFLVGIYFKFVAIIYNSTMNYNCFFVINCHEWNCCQNT